MGITDEHADQAVAEALGATPHHRRRQQPAA
jgi:hypothetical protein